MITPHFNTKQYLAQPYRILLLPTLLYPTKHYTIIYTARHYTTLHYNILHYTSLHHTKLHYTTVTPHYSVALYYTWIQNNTYPTVTHIIHPFPTVPTYSAHYTTLHTTLHIHLPPWRFPFCFDSVNRALNISRCEPRLSWIAQFWKRRTELSAWLLGGGDRSRKMSIKKIRNVIKCLVWIAQFWPRFLQKGM